MGGVGVYVFANKNVCDGSWKNSMMEGKGTFTYANGDKYVGDWKNGVQEGKGTFTWASGGKYVGDFANDGINGEGVMTDKAGKIIHAGRWKEGRPAWLMGASAGDLTSLWMSTDEWVGSCN
jgi:hypothetical protein